MISRIFLALLLGTLVEGCVRTVPSDNVQKPCNSCAAFPKEDGNCPYNNGCAACLDTVISYKTVAGCKTAVVAATTTTTQQYVRMERADGQGVVEVALDQLGEIRCGEQSQWLYSTATGDVEINDVQNFHYPQSTQQSPIDIMTSQVTYDPDLHSSALDFNYVVGDAMEMVMAPDSHGFTVFMHDVAMVRSTLTADHLSTTYKIYNVHAHWSDPAAGPEMGSEHLLNGMKRAAEIHLVHWNPAYGTFANAVGKPDGLAVLGVFVEIGAENAEFAKITDQIAAHLPLTGEVEVDMAELDNIDFNQFIPANHDYFTYTGSLTTPDFNTCVIWTVFKEAITISQQQYDILLMLWDAKNARDVQDVISPIRSSFVP